MPDLKPCPPIPRIFRAIFPLALHSFVPLTLGAIFPTIFRAFVPLTRRVIFVGLLPVLGLTAGACSGPDTSPDRTAEGAADAARSGERDAHLLVLAAASLADVLPPLGERWEAAGGAPVRFSFDATSRLATQAARGPRADVFLSADPEWLAWLDEREALLPSSARAVAGNHLVVVVREGGAFRPGSVDELPSPALRRLALGGENVPLGRYGDAALEAAGVWRELEGRVVRGGSARETVEWVARGEADAGVVYATDARRDPRLRTAFLLPPRGSATTPAPEGASVVLYSGAVLRRSGRPTEAAAFLDFLGSDPVQRSLREAGFEPAPAGGRPDAAARPGATDAVEGVGPSGPAGRDPADPADRVAASPQPPRSAALPDPLSAIGISLVAAVAAVLLGFLPALGMGWLLARRDFRGKSIVTTAVLSPLVLPPVVTGFLLLNLFGAEGAVGRWLAPVGLEATFSLFGVVLAALFMGFPLYVLAIRGAFEAVDPAWEELSWTLGVPPRRTFLRVTLPLALPGIAAGAVLAFARALGEFGATVVLAGNLEGETRTIALAVYTLLESPGGWNATWTLVAVSVALSAAALLGYEMLSRRQRRRLEVP